MITRCECGETVRKLRPDDETVRKYGSSTVEIGLDVIHIGAIKEYAFEAVIGYAFVASGEEAKLVEALVLHRCPRRR